MTPTHKLSIYGSADKKGIKNIEIHREVFYAPVN